MGLFKKDKKDKKDNWKKAADDELRRNREFAKEIKKAQRQANKAQTKTQPRRRKWLLVIGVTCGTLLLIAPSANKCEVHSPNHVSRTVFNHTDYPSVSAFDRVCALVGGCPFWDEPRYTFWYEQHHYWKEDGQWIYLGWNWVSDTCTVWTNIGAGCEQPTNTTPIG